MSVKPFPKIKPEANIAYRACESRASVMHGEDACLSLMSAKAIVKSIKRSEHQKVM